MSHVDEGALHAYLDGALDEYPVAEADRIRAHLEACEYCAQRLERERRVRADAHALLGMAVPDVGAPDFEELRAYVERTRGARGGMSTRVYRMRWAASILVALGTGWLLRGGLPGPASPALEDLQERRSVEGPTATARAEAEPVAVGAEESPVPAPSTVAAERPVEPDPAAGKAGAAEAADGAGSARGRSSVAQAPSAPAPRTEAVTASADVAEARVSSLPEAELRAAAEAEIRAPDERVVGLAVSTTDAAGTEPSLPAAGEPAPARDDRVALADRDRVRETDTMEEARQAAEDRADPESASTAGEGAVRAGRVAPVVAALEQNAFAPRRSVGEEVALPGEPPLVVPGYEVVSVTNLGSGSTSHGVHAVQRLEDGSTFEIFHLEPDVGRDVVPPPGPERNEVSLQTDAGWIVLQGPLPRSALEELLSALLPAG